MPAPKKPTPEPDPAVLDTLRRWRQWHTWDEIADLHAHDPVLEAWCRAQAKAESST